MIAVGGKSNNQISDIHRLQFPALFLPMGKNSLFFLKVFWLLSGRESLLLTLSTLSLELSKRFF